MNDLVQIIDHTMLKPDANRADILKCCNEAKKYGFGAVCVNGCYVKTVKEQLMGTSIKTVAVAGFPLGTNATEAKVFEARLAVEDGADEVDMVINIGALKDKDYQRVEDDVNKVVESVKGKAIVKVILETCLLTDEEIITACRLCEKAGAAFVKTSTGFNGPGAQVHHVKLMKQTVGDRLSVKAAGGIRNLQQALAMVEAGADRLGCSASVGIAKELGVL